jgi:two-component system, OmpR family, phosphate regulon response regulator PhoB
LKLKLLIADDDEDVQRVIKRLAERAGYEVIQVFRGPDVLPTAVAQRPDLVLLDVSMPGADGAEVLRQLKQDPVTANTPVILCSGSTDDPDRLAELFPGADDYVAKPFAIDGLLGKIATLMKTVLVVMADLHLVH